MAGIGFELVHLLKKNTYGGLLQAFSLTTLISVGPGLLVILSLGIVCSFSLFAIPTVQTTRQFLSVVIFLFSSSMIISSLLQYTFVRFMADLLFLKQFDLITPNFLGVLLVQLLVTIGIALPATFYFFADYNVILKLLLVSNFVILCLIWISTVLLTGFDSYKQLVWAFVIGYTSMILVHFVFESQQNELVFLLFEFLLAQCILFALLVRAIIDFYPSNILIQFQFLKKENVYYTLIVANFFYNLGFWIDKYLFWFNPETSYSIFPPLRLSPIYDLPMFISSLTIIPGFAVFMLQIESKFSLIFPKVMDTIFKRKTLAEIDAVSNELILSGREALYSLIKTQALVTVIVFLSVLFVFSVFNITTIYLNLLLILIVGASLNVILWGLISMLYYMTQYHHALYVTFIFVSCNFLFTEASLYAGPLYFGYGLSFSLLLANIFAFYFLDKDFKDIEYTAFMMVD